MCIFLSVDVVYTNVYSLLQLQVAKPGASGVIGIVLILILIRHHRHQFVVLYICVSIINILINMIMFIIINNSIHHRHQFVVHIIIINNIALY